jgi:hypothetical protein
MAWMIWLVRYIRNCLARSTLDPSRDHVQTCSLTTRPRTAGDLSVFRQCSTPVTEIELSGI